MKFLESLGNSIAKCLDAVTERNHRASLINRLRIVIKNERETTARAYVALGKYYYDHLRDRDNEETERLCRDVDESTARMRRAFDKMNEIAESAHRACDGCEDDCSACPYDGREELWADDEPDGEPQAETPAPRAEAPEPQPGPCSGEVPMNAEPKTPCCARPAAASSSGGLLSDFFTGRVRFTVLPDALDEEAAEDEA